MIHKINPVVDKNKSPMLLHQRIRKRYYKTLGTSVINSPMSRLSGLIYTVMSSLKGQQLHEYVTNLSSMVGYRIQANQKRNQKSFLSRKIRFPG